MNMMNITGVDIFHKIMYNILCSDNVNLSYNDMVPDFELLEKYMDKSYIDIISDILYKNKCNMKKSYSELLRVYEMYKVFIDFDQGRKRKCIS